MKVVRYWERLGEIASPGCERLQEIVRDWERLRTYHTDVDVEASTPSEEEEHGHPHVVTAVPTIIHWQ